MSDQDIANRLLQVQAKVNAASKLRSQNHVVRLVAASKTKSVSNLIAVYKAGQRNFGENYVQELIEKAHNEQLIAECPDIRWHLIGHLQKNKVPKVCSIPRLYCIETVDTQKLATALDSNWGKHSRDEKLRVMVQVNTSQEAEKFGCPPDEASTLVKFVINSCPNLHLIGLMTIGALGYDTAQGPNPDFLKLLEVRDQVAKELNLDHLELSMGMSSDYEHAIELGSTNVRVGTNIFGARDYKN